MVITVFGDSIVWGAYDPECGGWVTLLRNYFEKRTDDYYEVYNLGIDFDTTEDLLKRVSVECKAREPDIIMFAIGLNDSCFRGTQENNIVPLERFKQNLNTLINLSKQYSEKIVFIGLTHVEESKTQPYEDSTGESYSNEVISRYNEEIKSTAKTNRLLFIDAPSFSLKEIADGLHPNTQGHKKFFEVVKEALVQEYGI